MTATDKALPSAADIAGRVLIVEAEPGPERVDRLRVWIDSARDAGSSAVLVSGEVEQHGVWAGLTQLLWSIISDARRIAPELIERHAYELCLVLPQLRGEIQVKNPCLTDLSVGEEKVRNYPNDRVYRSLHGLVDFVCEWNAIAPAAGWAIACDAFDDASSLVQRFYAELCRRRGSQLNLSLLVAISPGARERAEAAFDSELRLPGVRLHLPRTAPPPIEQTPVEAGRLAAELEKRVGKDRVEWAIHIPRLLRLWQASQTPDRGLKWLMRAVNVYDHDGLYEIAVRYAPEVEAKLERMFEVDRGLHALAVLNLFFCYAALGRADDALRLLLTEGLDRVDDPVILTDIHYYLGMLYGRFLRERDFERATIHLNEALAIIPTLDVSDARRHFLGVFVRNGLAYVLFRQGRADDALQLCESGLLELDGALLPHEHKLHRSVLLYNAAQVLGALERHDDAIATLSRAMEMDPNYSEYYLERGALYLKCERFAEAERDLLRAIELSPPYPEVWTNLGQCYRAEGRFHEAEDAYSRALDLDPRVGLALVGRAEARSEAGYLQGALADYAAALAIEADQTHVLAARATVRYELGDAQGALGDLDRAIGLMPDCAELYQNRAVALLALGRPAAARRDLQSYLQLQPQADDRADVEQQLLGLVAA
jgi:tetratricopeptide (TPR) repeat protein